MYKIELQFYGFFYNLHSKVLVKSSLQITIINQTINHD